MAGSRNPEGAGILRGIMAVSTLVGGMTGAQRLGTSGYTSKLVLLFPQCTCASVRGGVRAWEVGGATLLSWLCFNPSVCMCVLAVVVSAPTPSLENACAHVHF